MTSRMLVVPTASITTRSMPSAIPPCGGAPVTQRFDEEAEAVVDLLVGHAQAMNTLR